MSHHNRLISYVLLTSGILYFLFSIYQDNNNKKMIAGLACPAIFLLVQLLSSWRGGVDAAASGPAIAAAVAAFAVSIDILFTWQCERAINT